MRRVRSYGFAGELLFLISVAVVFNAVALAGVALASGRAGPVQVAVGVSVFAMLMAALSAVVRGLRVIGARRMNASRQAACSDARASSGRPVASVTATDSCGTAAPVVISKAQSLSSGP